MRTTVTKSIWFKFIALATLLLVPMAVCGIWYVTQSQRNMFESHIRSECQTLVSVLATSCVDPMMTRDYPVIEELLQSIANKREDVVAISVKRNNEQVVAQVLSTSREFESNLHRFSQPIVFDQVKLGTVSLCISTSRQLVTLRKQTSLLAKVVAASLAVLVLMFGWLNHRIISVRLAKLGKQSMRLGSGDLESPITIRGYDEIGVLGNTIEEVRSQLKQLYSQLDDMRRQHVETARRAGMSEIASSVVHNVGNALNSVNVSIGIIREKLCSSKLERLSKANLILEQHRDHLGEYITQDEQGKCFPGFLVALEKSLERERNILLDESTKVVQQIGRVNQLIQAQQDNARAPSQTEELQINEVLDAAIEMQRFSLHKHQIRLIHDYGDIPIIAADKHRLCQVFACLLQQSKSACKNHIAQIRKDSSIQHAPSNRISIATRFVNNQLVVQFQDNGIGFPPEDFEAVFSSDYKSRLGNHEIGLHNGSLAACEMGGAVTAKSEGIGKGATFTFTLPVELTNHCASDKAQDSVYCVLA